MPPVVINGVLRKIRALYAELDKGNGSLSPLPVSGSERVLRGGVVGRV